MSVIIRDEVLETLTCSTCYKFLSVQPVKIYPNRKIRCGRCSEDGDAGAVSLYNLVALQCFFKCVNRFNGCNKLLNYSEVREHESKCAEISYLCPICPVSIMVPTFLMIPHFKEQHKSMFLDIPCFSVDLNETLGIDKLYLYRRHDRLFIVILKTDLSTNYITMSAMLLGDPEEAQNISQTFTLQAGMNFILHSEKQSCVVYDLSSMAGIKIDKSEISKYRGSTNITFKTDLVNVDGLINLQIRSRPLNSVHTRVSFENKSPLRYIYLNEEFQTKYPEISVSSTFTSIIRKIDGSENEIFLSCVYCSLMDYSVFNQSINVYIVKKKQKYYLKCFYCPSMAANTVDSVSEIALKEIMFFCLWKCGKYFNIYSLNEHEINCVLQPSKRCPVKYCKYENKIFNMKQHLIDVHHTELLIQDQGAPINVLLSIEKSPIEKFIVVAHRYIFLNIIWMEPQWNISISNCASNENHDELTPVARLYNKKEIFLHSIKQNETFDISHMETLKIKCYFGMNYGL